MSHSDMIQKLSRAIDAMDGAGFATFVTGNASFRFGNLPTVVGKENIRAAVEGFFSSIKGLSHRLTNIVESGDFAFVQGDVTYTRHSGSTLTVPFCNVFRMNGALIQSYEIYVDISALYAQP